ncbi:MAG: spore coat protein [Firmicutes bacterium]|nr:spore coat protein [Bacillota bacterium]
MGETIKNNKTPLRKGFELNDSDILNDILNSYKHLVVSYATSLNEASNKNIYKLFFELFSNTSKNQAMLFELAFKKGWYQLETADEEKIENAYNKFNKCLDELYEEKKTSN